VASLWEILDVGEEVPGGAFFRSDPLNFAKSDLSAEENGSFSALWTSF
jgi:hypothetical protein